MAACSIVQVLQHSQSTASPSRVTEIFAATRFSRRGARSGLGTPHNVHDTVRAYRRDKQDTEDWWIYFYENPSNRRWTIGRTEEKDGNRNGISFSSTPEASQMPWEVMMHDVADENLCGFGQEPS